MIQEKNNELMKLLGMKSPKSDPFSANNEILNNKIKDWSEQNISFDLLIQKFFNVSVRTKLIAYLSDIDTTTWVGIGASWQEKNQTGQIRIDSNLAEFLFNKSFGLSSINQPFDIKKLTELELVILQGLLENIEEDMKKYWEVDPKYPYLMETIYLVWLVQSEDGEVGKIAFGIPASFKPRNTLNDNLDVADIAKLAETGISLPIKLTVGNTKLSFNDIKSLERGDLVVFEDSDIRKMHWHFGEIGIVLPEKNHPVYLDVDNVEELAESMNENFKAISNDPLSTLPLELTAEFQKVKVPLKKVLELKSGGVLPLGPVLDTELTLTAQGNPVAKGELVIVGNQFGMRIFDLLIGTKNTNPKKEVAQVQIAPEEEINIQDELPSFEDELKNLGDDE